MDDGNIRVELEPTVDDAYHHGARRRHPRWALHADVALESGVRSQGVTLNASIGGLRVAMDSPLPESGVHVFRLQQRDRVVHQAARVVWQRRLPDGYLVGLEFLELERSFGDEEAFWSSMLPAAA